MSASNPKLPAAQNVEALLRQRDELDRVIREQWQRRVAVLFTDIKGSTEYFERFGDVAGRAMVQRHNDLLFPLIAKRGGKVVKTIGDAIMAFFESSNAAIAAASLMQQALAEVNQDASERDQLHVRIGIHAGDALVDDTDVYGDTVNTAARIEAQADAGQILISQAVLDELSPRPRVRAHGKVKLKGKEQSIALYEVRWQAGPNRRRRRGKSMRRTLVLGGVVVISLAAVAAAALSPKLRSRFSFRSQTPAAAALSNDSASPVTVHEKAHASAPIEHEHAAEKAVRAAEVAHAPPEAVARQADHAPTRAETSAKMREEKSVRPTTHTATPSAQKREAATARPAHPRHASASVGIIRLHLEHATSFTLDGHRERYTHPVELRLLPGKHALSLHGAGFVGRTLKLDVRAGEDRTVRITLAPMPHPRRRK